MKVIACIPVRGGSKRIPRKNLIKVNGESLIARKIRQLKDVATVVVGSDDDEMLEEASKHGALTVRRKCTNEGVDSANSMLTEFMNLIADYNPEIVMWVHCTNPLLSTATYARALIAFGDALQDGYDSLVSVHEIHGHYWNADMRSPLYNVTWCRNMKHLCANELPPLYEQDGGIFIQTYKRFKETSYFFGDRPKLFVVPENEFLDINTPRDVVILNAIIHNVDTSANMD